MIGGFAAVDHGVEDLAAVVVDAVALPVLGVLWVSQRRVAVRDRAAARVVEAARLAPRRGKRGHDRLGVGDGHGRLGFGGGRRGCVVGRGRAGVALRDEALRRVGRRGRKRNAECGMQNAESMTRNAE